MDRLSVFLGGELVGTLVEEESPGAYEFQYTPELAEARRGEPILSISLPALAPPYPAQRARPFFEGLLPEAAVREGIARHLKISPENSFGLLEELGRDCAGAVVLLPEGEEFSGHGSVDWLDAQELELLIQRLPTAPLGVTGDSKVRLSLAGLQRKAVLIRSGDGQYGIPNESAPSTHLMKPQYPDAPYGNLVYNEHFCMRVAACVGLDVARTEIVFVGEMPCLLVERFDRTIDGTALVRLHQEDVCQALGVPPGRKYENEGGPGLQETSALLRDSSSRAGADVLALVKAVVVNFVLGNSDAHAKNFALIYDASGRRLAPLYDIVSTAVYPQVDEALAMAIGAEFNPDRVSRDAVTDLARRCGLNAGQLLTLWIDVARRTVTCAERTAELMRDEGLHVPLLDRIVELARGRARQVETG